MADPGGVRRTTAWTAPRTRGAAPKGAGENARERRRARRARERVAAEARAAATTALCPPVGGEAVELEAAMEAAREAARRLNEALERCGYEWNDATLRAMLPPERWACTAGESARMKIGAGGTDGVAGPEERGDGAHEAGSGSAPAEANSDASMGNARSEHALGGESGEADDGAGPAEEGTVAVATGAGWSEVAGPSVKEEPESF